MNPRSTITLLLVALLCVACNGWQPFPAGKPAEAMTKSPKRGVAFSFTNLEDLPLLSPYISWSYNWGNTPSDDAALWFDSNEMDFCPMCWNGSYNADKIRRYVKAHPKTKYLLAFNEPNLTDQARLTPAEAAAIWPPVVALAKELNLKLVSPAMNYGTLSGYSDPITWLDEFFAQPEVNIADIYAISIHCYMASAGGMSGFVQKFYKYNKPIWLTEFCAWDPTPGSAEVQLSYMCPALNYLEQDDKVERYAWFIPRYTRSKEPYMQLITGYEPASLTDAGKVYTLFSSFDKSAWLITNRLIHAGEYISVSDNNIQLRPTNDSYATRQAGRDGLMISGIQAGQSVSYRIYVSSDSQSKDLILRYCGYANSICEVLLDGKTLIHLDLPRNGSSTEWVEAKANIFKSLTKGAHTLTFSLLSGSCSLSGFEIHGTDD